MKHEASSGREEDSINATRCRAVLDAIDNLDQRLAAQDTGCWKRLVEERGGALLQLAKWMGQSTADLPPDLPERLEAARLRGARLADRLRLARAAVLAEMNRAQNTGRLARAMSTGLGALPRRDYRG